MTSQQREGNISQNSSVRVDVDVCSTVYRGDVAACLEHPWVTTPLLQALLLKLVPLLPASDTRSLQPPSQHSSCAHSNTCSNTATPRPLHGSTGCQSALANAGHPRPRDTHAKRSNNGGVGWVNACTNPGRPMLVSGAAGAQGWPSGSEGARRCPRGPSAPEQRRPPSHFLGCLLFSASPQTCNQTFNL